MNGGGTVRLHVPAEAEGERLDRFLARHVPGRTRSALRRLIDDEAVTVDGQPARKAGLALERGMEIEVALPSPPPDRPLPESIPVRVLHEDDHLVLVAKPAGLVVHPGHGHPSGTLVNALLGRGTPLSAVGGPDRPGIVHRLDRDTSGVMVFAKDDATHLALAEAFARREVRKVYRAVVWGHPDPPEGTVDRSIGRSRTDRTKMTTRGRQGRRAVTHYTTMESFPGFAYLRLDLHTGRTHQIRVHLQSIHHPVVGDRRYGGRAWRGVQDPLRRKALREFDRLALHAWRLTFRHPVTGKTVEARAPIPDELTHLIAVLRGAQA